MTPGYIYRRGAARGGARIYTAHMSKRTIGLLGVVAAMLLLTLGAHVNDLVAAGGVMIAAFSGMLIGAAVRRRE
jgi:hypothetical protein